MIKKYFLLVLLLWGGLADAQKVKIKLKKADKETYANLQVHVGFLSDDKLEGRRTGTPGEKKAAEYISQQFQKAGLQPKGSSGYLQSFEVKEGKQIAGSTHLIIDGNSLELNRDYFPLTYSPNTSFEAMPSISLQEQGEPWFFNIHELIVANAANPHFDLNEAIREKAIDAHSKGAKALFIYNTDSKADGLKFNSKDKSTTLPIPVVYVTKEAYQKYLSDASAMLDMKFKNEITEKTRTGTNVVGFIDNGAAKTVVLGAHYDHLGYGEDNNSRQTGEKPLIHNGADDNASGTAALIELARLIRGSGFKNNNYLFIAFSGEELGLYGSKFFTENPTISLNSINYMINMDMVGRLNETTKTITVGGYGTSPTWGELYNLKGRNKLFTGDLVVKFDSTGTGPSDHTSFYLKNIPVLFYFTGLHTDYHKPSDDADKINFLGQLIVVKHIYSLIDAADDKTEKLVFAKTREPQTTTSARFTVTLGIMPDYTFSGAGVRVDGVSQGKPAEKAGVKAGDVITGLGDLKINSMESYMQALSKFKKGDKTKLTYTRGSETLSSTVEF